MSRERIHVSMWWDTLFLTGVTLGVLWAYQHQHRWTWYLRWGRWWWRVQWRQDRRKIAWLGDDYLLQRHWARLHHHWRRVPTHHR